LAWISASFLIALASFFASSMIRAALLYAASVSMRACLLRTNATMPAIKNPLTNPTTANNKL